MEFDAEFKFAQIQNFNFVGGGVGGFRTFDAESKFALKKSKIPILLGGVGGWGVGVFAEFDAEFKFAKIQNSHFVGGGVGGFAEFDAEFKFAKIKNSHFVGVGGRVHGI